METISYNREDNNKKKGNGPFIGIGIFLLVGIGIITYSLLNEAKPNVIGEQDSLKNVSVSDEVPTNTAPEIEISYKVETNEIEDKESSSVIANMQIPKIVVEGDNPFNDINAEIEKEIKERFNMLKGQMAGNVDNKYKYSVTYESYENVVNGKKILSIRTTEKMQDSGNKKITYLEARTYNIYINQKTKVDDKIAFNMYGKDYKKVILNSIRSHLVEKGYVKAENFKYDITDLELWYIKDTKMHIVFNPGKIAEDKFGIIDIEIVK